MKAGYARVNTKDKAVDPQVDALKKAGCTKVYTEVIALAHGGLAREFASLGSTSHMQLGAVLHVCA